MLEKFLKKRPKKRKLSLKEKRHRSLILCVDKRTILYPENRKWLGNFN